MFHSVVLGPEVSKVISRMRERVAVVVTVTGDN